MKRLKKIMLLVSLGFLLTGCALDRDRLEKEEAYRTIGIKALEAGEYQDAMEAFNQALEQAGKIGKNELDICYYKAAAQIGSGNVTDAIETYQSLLEADHKNADAYFLRGCAYLKINESAKALEDFDLSLQYAADDEMYLYISDALLGSGKEKEAEAYLEKALREKAGKSAKSYTVKGKIYLRREQYEEAESSFSKAVNQGDVEANLPLAQTYEKMGDKRRAMACIDRYIEANPESSVAYNELGRKEMETGNYEQAVAYFRQGLEVEDVTNEQEIWSNLIAAYEYSGDFESARENMEAYIKDYPNDEDAAREYLFLDKNRNKKADKE